LAARLGPLRPLQPRPLAGDGWAIVSASPELFLARRGDRVWTMPIKGTRPAGGEGLLESEKDAAEHVMIVDLERNDLSRVCEPGSVRWPELLAPRGLAGVEHLVSLVEGRLRPGVTLTEVLDATFPGGSVTGAPKIAAGHHIARLEPGRLFSRTTRRSCAGAAPSRRCGSTAAAHCGSTGISPGSKGPPAGFGSRPWTPSWSDRSSATRSPRSAGRTPSFASTSRPGARAAAIL